ncbi:hypothetical protein PISMIDRAFT_9516 [Pisolithus microcarpus 441]|uniref:Uncharacterized protein n=1 Tax=Pisolithus microcarpus 441 TaxID=765257 RepID=A0A0C9YKK2_9AGAM|nr:hypothetical protein BKA83DRAFT_9516 [Pisolithus microcarpus]KIK25480.1 hypothetical protein PISMIDRAFT_9516 [Pisolithus microcarpus 441]
MSHLPTELVFARPPTITMVEDVVLVDVDGLTSDWDTYTFSLDILSPGTKRIVLRVQHPDLYKCNRPRVREPYAQSVQLENVMLEYVKAIKSEESTEVSIAVSKGVDEAHVKPEPRDNHVDVLRLDSKDNSTNVLPSHKISLFPCHVLTRSTGNPAAEEGMPSQPWKYYVRSFNPHILPDEIASRNKAISVCEERLERGEKRRRVL